MYKRNVLRSHVLSITAKLMMSVDELVVYRGTLFGEKQKGITYYTTFILTS
jgi:hypothetical protein